eukprot:9046404-Pyramimonas_sp.AAC.1
MALAAANYVCDQTAEASGCAQAIPPGSPSCPQQAPPSSMAVSTRQHGGHGAPQWRRRRRRQDSETAPE